MHSDDKESACNAGDPGLIPSLGRSPGGGHSNPLQYSCLENPHGERSLLGYSPWSRKESDMTELSISMYDISEAGVMFKKEAQFLSTGFCYFQTALEYPRYRV